MRTALVSILDAGDPIGEFLSVKTKGNDTIFSIDGDGSGTAFQKTVPVTMNEVNTGLEELIANNQVTLF